MSAAGDDVFLSYSRADQAAVEAIARDLRTLHLEPFLDRRYLVPGQSWPALLEAHLKSCRAVAVFLGRDGMGDWQSRRRSSL